jgi:hypothetical protein
MEAVSMIIAFKLLCVHPDIDMEAYISPQI